MNPAIHDLLTWAQKLEQGKQLAIRFYERYQHCIPHDITHYAFFGMGGSGIAGRIMKLLLDQAGITSCIIASPEVPPCITNQTLCLVSTYSGDTWETIVGLSRLINRTTPCIVMSYDGHALQLAQENNICHVILPKTLAPRYALGTMLGFLLTLFDLMGVLKGNAIVSSWIHHAEKYVPLLAIKEYFDDFLRIMSKHQLLHLWGIQRHTDAIAYRAQTQFNENTKLLAFYGEFPEVCHNLLAALTPGQQPSSCVTLIITHFLSEKLNNALETTEELFKEIGIDLYKPPILGDTYHEQLFAMILWADFASCHLALMRGVDILPVTLIDQLKAKQQ